MVFIIVVNPDSVTRSVSIKTTFEKIEVMFENRELSVTRGMGIDVFRGVSVGVYKCYNSSVTASTLVFNPSFEMNFNPAVPDGYYVSMNQVTPGNVPGTFWLDSRLKVTGDYSLRLHSASHSVSMVQYTLFALAWSYTFSIWTYSVTNTSQLSLNFDPNIFNLGKYIVNATSKWTQHSVNVKLVKECILGCRDWLEYGLITPGDMWIDDLELKATL